jgi:hypothetical protein
MSPVARISTLFVAAALWATPAAATTWVVDDNGGFDFVNIQDAVDAAVAGDVILVHPGAYPGFTVDGKPLTIAPAAGGAIQVSSFVELRNIPLGTQLDISGLRMGEPFTAGGAPTVTVEACLGTVKIADCTVQGWDPLQNGCPYYQYFYGSCDSYPCLDADAQEAIECLTSAEVIFLRCTLKGGHGSTHTETHCGYTTSGADGASLSESSATFLQCTLEGGNGGSVGGNHCWDGGDGGHGVRLRLGSTVFADRTTFFPRWGGGYGCQFTCGCGDSGGHGAGIWADSTSAGTFKDAAFLGPASIGGQGAAAVTETFKAPYCLGTFDDCPCDNAGVGLAGCENAHSTGGVVLEALGTPSVSADTIRLVGTGMNPSATPAGLFFQGSARLDDGTVLNDGLLCASGDIIRLRGKVSLNGTVAYGFGNPADGAVSVRGAIPAAGGTRFYQLWYRSQPAMFCPPERFNMSNGIEIVWGP